MGGAVRLERRRGSGSSRRPWSSSGDDDYVTVSHAEEFSRTVENGQLAVVPGASHVVPMEKPDLFNRLVLDFLANPVAGTLMPLRRKAKRRRP